MAILQLGDLETFNNPGKSRQISLHPLSLGPIKCLVTLIYPETGQN
jgi:hypothetical protein